MTSAAAAAQPSLKKKKKVESEGLKFSCATFELHHSISISA
jgi:hypothetical protein